MHGRKNIKINKHCFSIQHWLIGLCNGSTPYCWGTNWIFWYNMDYFYSSKPWFIKSELHRLDLFCCVYTDWRKLHLESGKDWCSVGIQATTTTTTTTTTSTTITYVLMIYVTKHIKLWSSLTDHKTQNTSHNHIIWQPFNVLYPNQDKWLARLWRHQSQRYSLSTVSTEPQSGYQLS